jgi:hypothetical protein
MTTPPTLALLAPILLTKACARQGIWFWLMFEAYDDYTRIILDHGVCGFIGGRTFRLGFVYRLSLNIHDMHCVLVFHL